MLLAKSKPAARKVTARFVDHADINQMAVLPEQCQEGRRCGKSVYRAGSCLPEFLGRWCQISSCKAIL